MRPPCAEVEQLPRSVVDGTNAIERRDRPCSCEPVSTLFRGSLARTPPGIRSATAGLSGTGAATGGSAPWSPPAGASPRSFGSRSSEYWLFCRVPRMSYRSYLPLPIGSGLRPSFPAWAYPLLRLSAWSASLALPTDDLLCPLLTPAPRSGRLAASSETRDRDTGARPSPGKSGRFPAALPDLQSWPLMDMDFAIRCPLVRPSMPPIRFLFVRPAGLLHTAFRSHLTMTPLCFANPTALIRTHALPGWHAEGQDRHGWSMGSGSTARRCLRRI